MVLLDRMNSCICIPEKLDFVRIIFSLGMCKIGFSYELISMLNIEMFCGIFIGHETQTLWGVI